MKINTKLNKIILFFLICEFSRRDYGFLGVTLQQAVFKARNAPPSIPTSSTSNDRNFTTSIPQSTVTINTVINPIASPAPVPQMRQQITPRIA